MKTTNCTGLHQYHPRRDFLRKSSSLLPNEECQLQDDMNSARSKLGAVVNLHYVCSARQGTPTVLTSQQIDYLYKKKASNDGSSADGQTDYIYNFLEALGHSYICLLVQGPVASSNDGACKSILFNESRIGNITGQEDLPVTSSDNQDMLQIVNDHCHELKIADSKEMMVGIAYGMPYELEQFGLFHVSLHIDATADTNKEGRPLVTVTSKDSYGRMFFVLRAFLPCE